MRRLRDSDRQAIIARVELGLPYAQVAAALGKPNIAATHVAVSRALVRLAKEMAVRSVAGPVEAGRDC
jgi:RNA polymerase sigma-70 factor (ECF subfamily)